MRRAISFKRLPVLSRLRGFYFSALTRSRRKSAPGQPVDLNSATVERLQRVPGIGPKTASVIVNFRRKSGPFRRVEDLLAIKGISKGKLEELRPYVSVVAPPASKPH
jgi:competence protein ComEA